MIAVHCRVKHDPPAGTYGDCVRACVASLLDMETPEDVPHFYHDNPAGSLGMERMTEWLAAQGYVPFYAPCDGRETLASFLQFMGTQNPTAHYMLFGRTDGDGDHCVIGRGGAIVHNPAWFGCSIVAPMIADDGQPVWLAVVLARA